VSWIEDARDTHIAVTFMGDDYETCLVCSQPAPCLAIRLADELAAANTTIERVTHALDLAEERADDYDAGVSTGMKAALGRIRRALKGES
jgi:hypothetical protein